MHQIRIHRDRDVHRPVVQEGVVGLTTSTVYLGNLGSAYGHTARIHRMLAERAVSPDEREAHRAHALHWYRLGVATLAAVKARHGGEGGEAHAWEVHPDSLAAEYAALQASGGVQTRD